MSAKAKALRKAVNSIVEDIRSNDSKRQFRGTSKVSKLLRAPQRELEWESDQVIDAVVKTGAVSRLATFLERYDDHKLQSEAANALANISAGTSQNTCAVINAGVVPIATRLLASASSDLQDHAAWLLANIACESCACVLEAGALPPLLKLLDEQKQDTPSEISLVKTGTWLLSNLCQYTEDFEKVKDCLPRLAVLLKCNDEAVLKDGCWGLMYMCRLSIDAVVRSGACEPLTKLLMHSSDDVCCVALEALSAIFSNGSTAHKIQIAHYNVFPRLRYLLHSKRERTREITCSTLANVVRNEAKLLPDLVSSGVISSLLRIIGRHATTREGWLTWREAVRTSCCIVVSARLRAPDIIRHLVGHGLIMHLNETAGEAAYTSLELCIDPTLRLIEQLVEAGETQSIQLSEQKALESSTNDGTPDDGSDPAELADGFTNSYRDQIVECGLANLLSKASLQQIWKSGYDSRAGVVPPLPEHVERLCTRVESILEGDGGMYPATLDPASVRALRATKTYREVHALDVPPEIKAAAVGLLPHQAQFLPVDDDISSCVIEDTLAIKDIGDKNFISGRYKEASEAYSEALAKIDPAAIEALTLILLLNRSAAFMKMDLFLSVIADCSRGIAISENHIQCLQRRAIAYERSGQLRAALDDYYKLRGEEADISRKKLRAELGLQQAQPAAAAPPPASTEGAVVEYPDNHDHAAVGHGRVPSNCKLHGHGHGPESEPLALAPEAPLNPHPNHDGDEKGEGGISFCTYRLLREITQGYLAKAP